MRVRTIALGGLCVAMAACASVSPSSTHPTPSPTPEQVLFTADFTQGLGGWQATPGWTVTNGALVSSDAPNLKLTVPYQPPSGNYAVEFTLQILDAQLSNAIYLLEVPPSSTADGYTAGVIARFQPGQKVNGQHPVLTTAIVPTTDQVPYFNGDLPVADYEPGPGPRVYRMVVADQSVSIYVDGHFRVSSSSTKTGPLATGPLTFNVAGAHLRITSLRVIALP